VAGRPGRVTRVEDDHFMAVGGHEATGRRVEVEIVYWTREAQAA